MVDVAALGLRVDSSQVEKGTLELQKLTGAARGAETASKGLAGGTRTASAAAQGMASAADREAAALAVSTSALRVNTAAHQVNNAAMRMANLQRANLIFQLNDIGVSLASGMNPLMVAVQQGSQIATIYGPGEGGIGRALAETGRIATTAVTKFWPLAAAVGAVTLGFSAMTTEINRTAETQVSMADVMLASWQLLSERIVGFFQPVLDFFGGLWNAISPHIASAANGIIGAFDLAFRDIQTIWSMLPAAVGDAAIRAAQSVIDTVTGMIQGAIVQINGLLAKVRGLVADMGGDPGLIPSLGVPYEVAPGFQLPNPFGGAETAFNQQMAQNRLDVLGTDYLGLIGGRAQEIARARQETEALGSAAGAANDNVKKLADDGLKSAAERAQELADNMGKAIGGALRGLIEGTKSLGDVLRDVIGSLAQFAAQQAASLFGGMGGGFGFLGSLISGFFGGGFANGGVFSAGHQIHAFAQGGIVNRPTLFPMANGAGLMAEAGPEAIMPLRRGPNGKLGVISHANQNIGGRIHISLGWEQDGSGNIAPVIKKVANDTAVEVVAQATPGIVGASVSRSNQSAPAALARYQHQVAGGDYRD